MSTFEEVVDLAQRWARRGVGVLPIALGHDGARVTKRPLCDHGHHDATTDPDAVAELFGRSRDRRSDGEVWGVGLRPGPKYAVADVDVKDGAAGDETWAALTTEHGEVETYTAVTLSGGLHVWGAKEGHVGNTKALGPGIDVRADAGWVVAPGTETPWGTWQHEASSPSWPPAPWPAWVAERLAAGNGAEVDPDGFAKVDVAPADVGWWMSGPIGAGQRHHSLVSAAGWCRKRAMSVDAAKTFVAGVAARHDPPRYSPAEVDAKVEDIYQRHEAGIPHPNPSGDDDAIGALPDGHRMTDAGNAARFLELADGRARYVPKWGRWIVYRGGRWLVDDNEVLVTGLGKRAARRVFKVAAGINGNDDLRKKAWGWAVRTESAGGIAAMIRLARDGMVIDHEQLDADPDLFNCRNGTVDLRTGRLRPHDPDDLITLRSPVAYDPEARSELWESCLERWQPDPEIRDYLQRRAGASITGHHTETLDVDHGDGANGKSRFHGAIQHALGDHAVVPHKSLLIAQRHEQHLTEVAKLFRKRLAVASETSAADVLDDTSVKNLTGGDRLSGRRMREDPWEFQPSHTLVMSSNHRPAIRGRDLGIWRRVRLVPWAVTIPEAERDTDLPRKLREEGAGVLAWVVAGARRFLAEGLAPPARVRAATAEYRADEDVVGRFLADCLTFGGGFISSHDIKAELAAWCVEQGVREPRMNEIAAALRQKGARDGGRKVVDRRKVTIWYGVALREM